MFAFFIEEQNTSLIFAFLLTIGFSKLDACTFLFMTARHLKVLPLTFSCGRLFILFLIPSVDSFFNCIIMKLKADSYHCML